MNLHATPGLLLGCTATGVIGGGQEIEERGAIAAIGAVLEVYLYQTLRSIGSALQSERHYEARARDAFL